MLKSTDTEYDPVVMEQMLNHIYGAFSKTRQGETNKDRIGRN